VTRLVGDHELREHGAKRRYVVAASLPVEAWVSRDATVERDGEARATVTVRERTGVVRLRVQVADGTGWLWLPGPSFSAACETAADGDRDAARRVLAEFESATALAFALGELLDGATLVDVLDAVAAASERAADDLHARRYDFLRGALVTTAGPNLGGAEEIESLVGGLDGIDDIGDVAFAPVVADAMALATETVRGARAFVRDHGYSVADLVDRDDRFFAYWLAHAARTGGVRAAKREAAGRSIDASFEAARGAAEHADYWDRGGAWRDAAAAAASESDDAFAFALANALYWTGEVDRGDSRVDELLFDGAEAAARDIGLAWVTGHARFERARAVGHRHRTSTNHALAISAFEDAREVASEYDFLDPWEPTYSRAVVASNMHSARGDHDAAIDAIEAGKAALAEQAVPSDRREEMVAHLDAQRRERLANQTTGETRRTHLDAALAGYESIGFERSVERVREKLATDTSDDDEAGGAAARTGAFARRQSAAAAEQRGPSVEDIPALHDFLTETDPNAVGSADPGVLPGEREDALGDPEF
jgi:hypothetical protein